MKYPHSLKSVNNDRKKSLFEKKQD